MLFWGLSVPAEIKETVEILWDFMETGQSVNSLPIRFAKKKDKKQQRPRRRMQKVKRQRARMGWGFFARQYHAKNSKNNR